MLFEPHPYQRRIVDHIKATPFCGVFAEMGLGKTVSALTAIVDLLEEWRTGPVLVIAPLRVCEHVWWQESAKWEHSKHLRVAAVLGDQRQRVAALSADADIWLINRENVVWLCEHFRGAGQPWPFSTVIIDESDSFKAHDSQRFKALRRVRASGRIERCVLLTGTPAASGIADLWSQIYLLDLGARLGKNITAFRARYMRQDRSGYGWEPVPGAAEKVQALIADICISLRAQDWLALPERIDRRVVVGLSPQEMHRYKRMERDFLLPLAEGTIVAANAAVLAGKLLQLAGGSVYRDDGVFVRIHNRKLEALAEIIEECRGRPVLIGYAYKHEYAVIKERFPQAVEIRERDAVPRWNRGEIPILLAHPASAGHGLNLQAGGNTAIWYSLPWSLRLYQQFNARLHRQGQGARVIVHHLICVGTIDEDVVRALADRDDSQARLMAALRARVDGQLRRAA